jgi:molybdopterin converting factor small subunit
MSSSPPASLRVLFLGPLRDRLGTTFTNVSFPSDGSQAAFWTELRQKFPALESSGCLRLARDDEFLDPAAPLRPGDELALIPPVSGG